MNGRDQAERERTINILAKKMLTPPFDPENPPPPPPTSYERFTEVANDLRDEGETQAEARNATAKELWGE